MLRNKIFSSFLTQITWSGAGGKFCAVNICGAFLYSHYKEKIGKDVTKS